MGIALGPNQYGKAENRVVRIYRDTDRHEIRDLNVSTSLRGDFTAAHITGDQGDVLPTDTQKNTAFAFAKEKGIISPEQFGIALGAHFLDVTPKANASRSGSRSTPGSASRWTAPATTTRSSGADPRCAPPWSPPTTAGRAPGLGRLRRAGPRHPQVDRIGLQGLSRTSTPPCRRPRTDQATSLTARWRYEHTNVDDWNKTYDDIKRTLLEVFASAARGPRSRRCT